MAIKLDKVLIDDFTQHAQVVFIQRTTDDRREIFTYRKGLSGFTLLAEEKIDYQRSIVPYIVYFLLKTGMRFGELVC